MKTTSTSKFVTFSHQEWGRYRPTNNGNSCRFHGEVIGAPGIIGAYGVYNQLKDDVGKGDLTSSSGYFHGESDD